MQIPRHGENTEKAMRSFPSVSWGKVILREAVACILLRSFVYHAEALKMPLFTHKHANFTDLSLGASLPF